jgi:hypothetical protein
LTVTDNADATGATAYVSDVGSSAGVTLYRQPIDGEVGSAAAWAIGGTRTGPGPIADTGATKGFYWWYATSRDSGTAASLLTEDLLDIQMEDGELLESENMDKDLSNVVLQQVSDGNDAVQERILAAVHARASVLLAGRTHIDAVVRQKMPFDLNLGMKSIVVTCFEQTETDEESWGTANFDGVGRPVHVLFIDNQAHDEDDGEEALDHKDRELIRRGFHGQRLPGVNEVMRCTVEPGQVMLLDANKTEYLFSGYVIRPVAKEPRGFGA